MRFAQPLALVVLTCAAVSTAVVARALSVQPTTAFDLHDVAFKEKLKKAVATGKKPDVESLVKSDTTQAAAWILRLGEILVDRDDPNEKPLRDALVEAWNTTQKSAYPAKVEEFLKSLDADKRRTRADLRKRFTQVLADMQGNRETKDGLVFVQTTEELDLLATSFDSEKDYYSASEAYFALAECFDEPMRGTDAEPHKAWKHWTHGLEFRAKVELKDDRALEAEKRIADLVKKGHDKEGGPAADPGAKGGTDKDKEKGGGGGKGGEVPSEPVGPPSDAGNPVTVALTFEPLAGPEAFQRPCFQADEMYALWNPVPLAAKGSSGTFSTLGGESPVVHRVGSADIRIDVDGDGKGDGPTDMKLSMAGAMTPFRVQIGKGDAARPWAFFGVTGIDKDVFQGIEVNFQPSDTDFRIHALSAASVVGTIGTTPVRIIDDTMDGVYGSEVLTFGYGGLANGSFQPELDSIVIGSSKRARPWSRYQEIGGAWWKLDGGSKGKEVLATPTKLQTGMLKLECKGVMPTYAIVKGSNELKDCYFDLVEGGAKGVAVPVGRYTLFCGDVRKGKKRQMIKALMLPGRGAGNYDVKAGATTVVTLGAPYSFDWTANAGEDKVRVVGASVVVTGVGGERYERAWNCVPRPEVSWRKKGTKKAAGVVKMPVITDQETLYKRGNQGWLDVWFPLDTELEIKGTDAVELQLVDEKNKLFGKIESSWKE